MAKRAPDNAPPIDLASAPPRYLTEAQTGHQKKTNNPEYITWAIAQITPERNLMTTARMLGMHFTDLSSWRRKAGLAVRKLHKYTPQEKADLIAKADALREAGLTEPKIAEKLDANTSVIAAWRLAVRRGKLRLPPPTGTSPPAAGAKNDLGRRSGGGGKYYSPDDKKRSLALAESLGFKKAAAQLGVVPAMLYRWRDELRRSTNGAAPASAPAPTAIATKRRSPAELIPASEELARLRKDNAILRMIAQTAMERGLFSLDVFTGLIDTRTQGKGE